MFERDFIKRLIQQFAQVVEKLIVHKKQQDWQQVQMVIDVSAKQLLGLNPDLIESLDSSALISLFQISDEMDYEKCFILGSLLLEQAVVFENTGADEHKVFITYVKSFDLLEKAMEHKELRNKENISTVVSCCESLQQYRLEEKVLIKIFYFYKSENKYAEAENIILHLLKENPLANKQTAKSFYSNLLQLSDTDLKRGKLPRDEVLEGLNNLDKINEVV